MSEKREHDDEEIKITDHRRFTAEGEERPDTEPKPAEEAGAGPTEPKEEASAPEEPKQERSEAPGNAAGEPPPIDFATFVLSLATSAQVHLGAIPNPATGKAERNPQLARQTIDILGVLQEKTRGNLSPEEARLLEQLLYDLRMMYVQVGDANA